MIIQTPANAPLAQCWLLQMLFTVVCMIILFHFNPNPERGVFRLKFQPHFHLLDYASLVICTANYNIRYVSPEYSS